MLFRLGMVGFVKSEFGLFPNPEAKDLVMDAVQKKPVKDMQCGEPFFSLLASGAKPVEGRKGSPRYNHFIVSDTIRFLNDELTNDAGVPILREFFAEVVAVRRYRGETCLDDYLRTETVEKVMPGFTIDEAKAAYLGPKIGWTQAELDLYGVMAIQVVRVATPTTK